MRKLNPDDVKTLDALENAASLYQRYVDLARLSEIPNLNEESEPVARASAQPVGFVIKPTNQNACLE